MLEKILSIIVFELEVTLVGWIMYERNTDEARESKNSLAGECCSYFERSTLKSSNRKTVFFSLLVKHLLKTCTCTCAHVCWYIFIYNYFYKYKITFFSLFHFIIQSQVKQKPTVVLTKLIIIFGLSIHMK